MLLRLAFPGFFAVCCVAACSEPDVFGDGRSQSAASSAASGGASSTSTTNVGAGPSSSSGIVNCTNSTPPTLECDASCDQCLNGVCIILCDGAGSCAGRAIDCPEGLACEVRCTGGGCAGTTVQCPALHECFVECSGTSSCQGAEIQCGANFDDGVCQLACRNGVDCSLTTLTCGANYCVAMCDRGTVPPTVDCGTACNCAPCN